MEDLKSGDYLAWLEANWNPDLPMPDADKHKIVVGDENDGAILFMGYNDVALPPQDRPYSIGFTTGYTKCNVSWGGVSHEMTCAVVPIAMSVPEKPGKTRIVIGLIEVAYDATDAIIAKRINDLQGDHIMMLFGYQKDPKTGQVVLDDLVDQIDVMEDSIKNYPDIVERVQKYRETLDPSLLSGKGLFFQIAVF